MFTSQALSHLVANLVPIGLLIGAFTLIELVATRPGMTRSLCGIAVVIGAVLVLIQASRIGRMRQGG